MRSRLVPRRIRVWLKRLVSAGALAGIGALLAFGLLWLLFPFPEARIAEARAGASALILDREGGLLAWRVNATEEWRLSVQLDEVSPWMLRATVAAEDKRFWSHCGVDPAAVTRALTQNLTNRRRVSGASTVTMQAVRLLRPRQRTYSTKCVEAFRALELEALASKEEILELYLNLAPYGGNVVGVEAAAQRYFAKRAADLTLGEAALLAGVPQRPARFNPRKHLEEALRRRAYVLDRMRALGLVTENQRRAAEREPIAIQPALGGVAAPRFADYVLQRCEGGVLRTTLDPEIQAVTREVTRRHAAEHPDVDGCAVVVIDVASSSLAAMFGSLDPEDPQTGLVNAAARLRQPGSLLKPFIYAAAFDSGELTPARVVYDVPVTWRGYRPRNMDRRYLGPMSASQALRLSRNVPAVRLLDRIGTDRLSRDLKRLGIEVPAAEERCGLSLALGTAEVRPIEVANAYAALARLGAWRPLRVLQSEGDDPLVRVYSPGAAYLLLRALGAAGPSRPPRPVWKTGTSWQHRDAWAVAVTPRHVVTVWRGRLSGREHPVLTGARVALPLALEIAERISGPGPDTWSRPEDVRTRRICALSGVPPGAACPETTEDEYLPGLSAEAPCAIHRFRGEGGDRRVVTVWPENVTIPHPREAETPSRARASLVILSPADDAKYLLPPDGAPASRSLHFRVHPMANAEHVYWFLDGELVARARPHEAVPWLLRPGRHELVVSDGRSTTARIGFDVAASSP